MKILLFVSILAFSFSVFATECESNSYVVSVDPQGTAATNDLVQVIRILTDYSNGLAAGDLHIRHIPYPVLTVNYDANRGELASFENAIALLQANPAVLVECADQSVVAN